MSIEWRPAMSTGVGWIDEQHQVIFIKIRHLYEAIEENRGAEVVKDMLEFLEVYSANHFREEEEFMRNSGCRNCELHELCHKALLSGLAEIRAMFERQGASTMVILKLQALFRDWLMNHMFTTDKKMVAGLTQQDQATAIAHAK